MMKQNFLVLQSVVRQFRQSPTFNVKSLLLHSRLQSHSAYQQFDAPNSSSRTSNNNNDTTNRRHHHTAVQTPHHQTLQKIARKCFRQLSSHQHSKNSPSLQIFTSQHCAFSTQSRRSVAAPCWSCALPQRQHAAGDAGIFCTDCGIIQDLPERSDDEYFALFGLQRTFALDTVALTRKFRQLQSVIHPDKFSNRSEKEQHLSADWSSLVNNAYKTLLAPIKRGEYILRQHGIEIPEGNTAVGSDFLMEMMERNEEVDDAHTGDALVELLHRVQADLQQVVGKLDASLQVGNLDTALADVITLRYLVSLETSIKAKTARLGVVA